ncbi:MAG: lysine--tRNA ligase [Burkholderiales bacterium]|nr:lysine--tRNA ligase [Burkholderiales bacterium]
MTASDSAAPAAPDENQIIAERRAKLAAIRARGGAAFPNDFVRRDHAGLLHTMHGEAEREALAASGIEVSVAGRMMLKRVMGKASFATVQDGSGQIQLYINDQGVGAETHADFKHWDLGDIVGAQGTLFKTQKGELSVNVTAVRLLTKALRPLPEKFHGLTDMEARYRQRYLDLISSESSRRTFIVRSQVVTAIRAFMVSRHYLEVETPMMHPIPGGAAAKPFKTHHNALDMELYLRIAPELYLKRLVVGGFERVFEINRNFRNEGISTRHNPEFTMMEFYEAYRDYRYLMDLTETMFREVSEQVLGSTRFTYQGREIDFGAPFDRLTIVAAIRKYAPEYGEAQLNDASFLRAWLDKRGALPRGTPGMGALQLAFFEETAEAQLWNPTFIIDYPAEVSPLARRSDADASITERFELFIAGREIANGFSELNDAEDQEARFDAQVAAKEAGDEEAMFKDRDYIRALEHGLPPTAGEGIGIDRLVMLMTDAPSIRDVILFPQLKREA